MSEGVRSGMVGSRADLAKLSNRKQHVIGVEIGTDRGGFAKEFLGKWTGEILYCVDPYAPYAEMPWDRTGDLLQAIVALANDSHRVRFVKASSLEVADYCGRVSGWPERVDFVYIDGAHDYESVKRDLAAWWPRLSDTGILAGDDYGRHLPGVAQAVDEFAIQNGLLVQLTTDYDRDASWFIEK